MNRNFIFYILVIGIFGGSLWLILLQGKQLEAEHSPQPDVVAESAVLDAPADDSDEAVMTAVLAGLAGNLGHPLTLLLLQVSIIILFSRCLGFLFAKLGQPTFTGEILAGIILGPSVLGGLWPEFSAFLFRPESLPNLHYLSQLGLLLFMFIIGLEMDVSLLKHKVQAAVVVSHASIVFPFFLGVGLAYFLFPRFAPAGVAFVSFSLFMGIAMSVTAFPVLARIIQERGLSRTALGVLALTCAAADDITAWCILAAVLAVIQAGTLTTALFTILLSGLYLLAMLYLVHPLLQYLGGTYGRPGQVNKTFIAFLFSLLFLSACATEIIGIHALFGAFLAGAVMPSNSAFRRWFITRIEDVSLVILLPLFFASTGLKTQIGLINGPDLWLVCGLILLVAVIGKFGGSLVAARFTGQSWGDSLVLGALMNTRGLMELVVLNIGYDLGILSPAVFTMMVLMALATTFMTCPILSFIGFVSRKHALLRSNSGVRDVPLAEFDENAVD